MKIIEAIAKCDNLKVNTFSQEDKIAWLRELDGMIQKEITSQYQGFDEKDTDYTVDDIESELLVEKPHDVIYPMYLSAQIDYALGEIAKYNNSMAMYNTSYNSYRNYINSTHLHKSVNVTY